MIYVATKWWLPEYTIEGFRRCDVSDAVDYCKSKKIITIDTETTGLDPFLSKVVMLQAGDLENQFVIDTRFFDPSPLHEVIQSTEIIKLGVNLSFDYKMMLTNFGIRTQNLWDLMLNEMVIHCGKRGIKYSMQAMAARYLNINLDPSNLSLFDSIYKDTRSEFKNINGKPFTKDQILYGANDVRVPFLIKQHQDKIIKEDNLTICCKLENKYCEVQSEIELNGFYLNTQKWMKTYKKYQARLNWKKYVLKEYMISQGLDEEFPLDINWNSHHQVVKLFRYIGVPTKVIDKKKSKGKDDPVYKHTVNKLHISKYKKDYPIVSHYLQYKQYAKYTSTYGIDFLSNIHPSTGRIHSSFYQILNTGRVSSSKPNLQNIPRGEDFRACFTAPHGTTLIVADYSG